MRVTNAGWVEDKRFTASHSASQASGSDEKDGVAQTQCGVRGCRGVVRGKRRERGRK